MLKRLLIAAVMAVVPLTLLLPGTASASVISHNATYGVNHNTFEFGYSYNDATGTLISVPQQVVTYLPEDAWNVQVCTYLSCTPVVGPVYLGPGDGLYEPWIVNWPGQAVPGNVIGYSFCRFADRCYQFTVTLLNKLNDN